MQLRKSGDRRNWWLGFDSAQPGILLNNRSGLPGDFRTPEQTIPHGSQPGVFESCVTMTHKHWGYCPSDHYKDHLAPAR